MTVHIFHNGKYLGARSQLRDEYFNPIPDDTYLLRCSPSGSKFWYRAFRNQFIVLNSVDAPTWMQMLSLVLDIKHE